MVGIDHIGEIMEKQWWHWLLIVTTVFVHNKAVVVGAEVIQEFDISEGVPVGTSIGFIGKPIPGSSHPPPPPPYLIVPVPGSSVDSDLTIDQGNGEILTRIQLDRETRDSYSLVAIPMTGENIRVIIRVKDENDHAPEFPSSFVHVEFPENTPRDVKRTLQPARDKDLGIYNTQRYTISAGNVNNVFRLSSHRERDGVLYLDLQVNGFLDRETTPSYSLLIDAFDGGIPPLKGSMTINITITDQNDNAPIWQFPRFSNGDNYHGENDDITFNQSRYFATVPENATVGTSVLQVFATDIDEGPNGQVSYSINRRQTDKDSVFRIDPKTGIIHVNGPLDFETKEVYELVVVARDNGIQPLETTVFVSIRVLDLNDNQMEISVSFFSGDSDGATAKVSEKALAGEFVARINVIDPDSKQEYNNVTISLLGDEGHFALETVNSAVYLVVASRKLDRERKPTFTLTVIATDKGNPYLNASTKFILQIEDDNDSVPKFELEDYHASVLEISEPGTLVIQVKAVDYDIGENARVSYEIIPSPETHSEWFQINEESGIITTKSHIDCEIDPTPRLTVLAKDHGKPPLSSSATVSIHLIDTNDTPIFDLGFYNASVTETAPYGTCLLKVSASDPDCGVNADLAYSFLNSPAAELPFSVNPKSGEICVSGPLDYENKDVYQILVTATDTGGLSSTAVVNIKVVDENDNIPTFYPSNYAVSVKEGVLLAGVLVSVSAVDGDSGRFGKVVYSIEDGNEDGLFVINGNTGEISMIRAASKSKSTYRMKIIAKDGDNQFSEHGAEVTVHVFGSDFQAPMFQKPRYTFVFSEDVGIQSSAGTVSAAGNGRIRYSIISGDPQSTFTIDSDTGTIKTLSKLDHEEHSVFLLNIQAKLDQHEVMSYCQVEIRITDVNDDVPKFDKTEAKIWVPETAEIGSVIYAAIATDKDSEKNGEIVYFLAENSNGNFKLDRSSGLLTIQKALDYESVNEYTVIIAARDNGSPQRRSENLTLQIEVQDSNDNAPIWHKTKYEFWIKERSPSGSYIGRISKREKNEYGATKFYFQPPNAIFRIDADSGIINTTSSLPRNISIYHLNVIAYNQEVSQQKAELKIIVHLADAGSRTKTEEKSDEQGNGIVQYFVNITESLPVNSEIMQILALDDDIGNNARISYRIGEPQLKNIVDVYPTTGIVYLKETLDREMQDVYLIKVIATDHGVPPLSSTTTIHLTVTDENDNSPKFERELFRFSMQENNEPGTEVGRVTAHDKDSGVNGLIRYFFQPTNEYFSIDANTGKITATTSLDREKQSLYELQAVAIDQGSPPQQSEVIVQVTLNDENDNEPQIFEPDHDFLTIREQLPVGTELGRIVAKDPDEGRGSKIVYSLINDGYTDSMDFSIDAESGVLKTKKVLIRDTKTFYTLRVKARDSGVPTKDSNREYRIEVLDINDKRLDSIFVPSKLMFQVYENVSLGHVIGSVNASFDEKNQKSQVSYTIVGGNTHESFEIHATTGSIVVANELNYEETPHYRIQVKVLLKSSSNPRVSVITVEIGVLDINDEKAKFPQDPTIFTVSESTPIGTSVWNFTAVDNDAGLNGILHYSIVQQEPSKRFRINMLTGTLYLQSQLDYEKCNSYILIVSATDQSPKIDERLNSSVTVNIFVDDENDNVPFFTSTSVIDIYELEPLKTQFHTVIAIDLDSKENGRVTYQILSGNDEGIFELNSENGRLTLSKPLKRDVKRYSLNISATDHGSSPNVAAQLLSISVKAYQNSSPRFNNQRYEAKILENSPIGTQVLKVTAIRGDLDRNTTLRYIIPEGMADGKFKMHQTTGTISVAGPIDREEESEYTLMVYVQDQNQLHVYDTSTVFITLLDDNDNAPNFWDSCSDLTVPENNELGVIHVFTAEDRDLGNNGEVTFVIAAGNVENMFNVDLHSGKLTGRPLDRERRAQYNLLIIAQDQGTPSRKTTCNMTISVDDENDSPIIFVAPSKSEEQSLLRSISSPEFRETQSGQPIYSSSIPENVPVGTTVLKVQATDADIGVNSVIKYSLNNESHWHFTIDNTTGSIVTAGTLDREKINNYMFEVAATDGGLYDSRSSTALVHFTIADYNDNRPLFRENPVVAKIPPYTKAGQSIVEVLATDADDGTNAEVTYSLETQDSLFVVNPQTGQISAVTSLTAERGRIFHLKVIAKDQGQPSMSSTALVIIQVGESGPQNVLKFQESQYKIDILENSPIGTEVLKVTAIRNDGRRARINYSIVGGNEENIFEIASTTGLIRIKDPLSLDRERESKYKLVISAKAEGTPPQFAHTVAHITLLDVNDNFPRFTQESYIASVWEGNTKGTFVTQVTATDNDEGSNANVIYHIIDGNRDNAFVIEPPFSGIVKTNIVLDREILDEYRLTIIATDEGSPQMTGTCFLHVNVIDIQDQSPVFPPHSVISVKEDAPVGTLITTMVANDVDTNPTLVYGFTEQGNLENMFSMGKYSGRVTLIKPLDYENKKSYTAKIQVSDSVHTAFTTLTVNVLDSNDHRPHFSNDVYRFMIPEGTKLGTKIGQVNATDKDTGSNGSVKYTLKNPNGLKSAILGFLRIDEDTGGIYLNGTVVYRSKHSFSQLIVVAYDNGKPIKSSEATLWIEIRPSNSHILKFSQNKYRATIDKDAKAGTIVTQLLVEQKEKLSNNIHFHVSIVSGNDDEYFSVNSHNGQVMLAKPFYEKAAEYYILTLSVDCVNLDQCSSVSELVIDVSSTIVKGPVFDKRNYRIVVGESKPVGAILLKLQGSDTRSNESVMYEITSGNNQNVVELNRNTGVMILKRSLDYDSISHYQFVVKAIENRTTARAWNLTTVEMILEDDNDNEPKFLFSQYLGIVGENEPIGTTVCTVRATDLDKGIYGKLQYSIMDGDGKDKFNIGTTTGVVTTNAVFDYESKSRYYVTVRANDIGGKSSTAKLQIEIDSRDEFPPHFVQKSYSFEIPINAEPGHIIGRVEAIDQDRGPDGRLTYQMLQPNENFFVNQTNGVVILKTTPNPDINATVMIMAASGKPGSKSAVAVTEIVLGKALKELEVASSSVTDWVLGLLVTMLLLLVISCIVFVLIHLRNKRQSKKGKEEGFSSPNFDTLDYAPTTMRIGSTKPDSLYGSHYGNLMDLRGNERRRMNNTISELSDQSNSASSGRGSAEDGEEVEDEEICMINEGTLVQQQLRGGAGILDSGIQDNDDTASQNSAKNTQEYLARLGIRPKVNDGSQQEAQSEWGSSHNPDGLDNLHLYDEKDGRGVDISALIYAQISEDLNNSVSEDKSSVSYKNVPQPSVTGSLSSIVHNEEELAGSYNWDYLLDWGPQYQPLAHVFSEIAHMKDDSSNRSEPTYCGIHSRNVSNNQSSDKINNHPKFSSTVGSSRITNAPRTGPLPPLPILPRSPIPNDIHFSSGPISPSFSPALSPLANRSPSISPLGGVTTNNIRPSQLRENYRSESDLGV